MPLPASCSPGRSVCPPQPIFASASSHAAVEACRRKQAVAWLRLQNDEPGRSTDGGSERHSVPFPAGSMDAIFQPQPHGVIADNPLRQWCHYVAGPARGCTIFSRGRDRLRAASRASHAMKGPPVQVTTRRTATSLGSSGFTRRCRGSSARTRSGEKAEPTMIAVPFTVTIGK